LMVWARIRTVSITMQFEPSPPASARIAAELWSGKHPELAEILGSFHTPRILGNGRFFPNEAKCGYMRNFKGFRVKA
jgi:hypothetical protein